MQTLSSEQANVLFVLLQPPLLSHVSVVHGLPSSHRLGTADMHVPPLQVSPLVQASLSSQGAVLYAATHPLPGAQVSSVHGLPSSHAMDLPAQTPPLHASPLVHASASSQPPVAAGCWQTPPTQLSYVQSLPSLHTPGSGSSVLPSQSSSRLLQVSLTALGALQAPKPATEQLRSPPHLPAALAELHTVASPSWIARPSQAHCKSVLRHCIDLAPPTLVTDSQP